MKAADCRRDRYRAVVPTLQARRGARLPCCGRHHRSVGAEVHHRRRQHPAFRGTRRRAAAVRHRPRAGDVLDRLRVTDPRRKRPAYRASRPILFCHSAVPGSGRDPAAGFDPVAGGGRCAHGRWQRVAWRVESDRRDHRRHCRRPLPVAPRAASYCRKRYPGNIYGGGASATGPIMATLHASICCAPPVPTRPRSWCWRSTTWKLRCVLQKPLAGIFDADSDGDDQRGGNTPVFRPSDIR